MAQAAGGGLAMGGGISSATELGGGSTTALLQQILMALRQQQQGNIGREATIGGLGAVNQQFGSMNFNGVQNLGQLYAQLNKIGGYGFEDAQRGSTSGMGL